MQRAQDARALVSFGVPPADVEPPARRAPCARDGRPSRSPLWKSYAAGVAGCSARVWVLRGASLEVRDGECVAILGARGAGTTTLLHCLAGLRRIDAGTIEHRRPPLLFAGPGSASMSELRPPAPADIMLIDDAAPPARSATVILASCVNQRSSVVTTIIATHELSRVRHLVDRVLLLRDGRLTSLPLRSGSRRVAEVADAQSTTSRERSVPTSADNRYR